MFQTEWREKLTNNSLHFLGNVIVLLLFLCLHLRSHSSTGCGRLGHGEVCCKRAAASLVPENMPVNFLEHLVLCSCFIQSHLTKYDQMFCLFFLPSEINYMTLTGIMSDLQAAKRGFRKVRPSLWISLTPSFRTMASLLSDRCFCSRHCRTVGTGKHPTHRHNYQNSIHTAMVKVNFILNCLHTIFHI